MQRLLVLVDHGSRRAEANQVVVRLGQYLSERLEARGERMGVVTAHLEAAQPDLRSVLVQAIARGAREFWVQPVFLTPGRHASVDIPGIVEDVRSLHPGVIFHVGAVIGADPLLGELLLARLDALG